MFTELLVKKIRPKASHDTLLCYSLTKWAGPLDIYRHSVISTIMLQNISKTVEHLVPVSFHWFEITGRTRYRSRGIHMTDLHEGERHKQTFKSHQDYIAFRKNIKFITVFRLEGRQTCGILITWNMNTEHGKDSKQQQKQGKPRRSCSNNSQTRNICGRGVGQLYY